MIVRLPISLISVADLGARVTAALPMTCSQNKDILSFPSPPLDTEANSFKVVLKFLVLDATWIKGFVIGVHSLVRRSPQLSRGFGM